jgi:hypothetical protein
LVIEIRELTRPDAPATDRFITNTRNITVAVNLKMFGAKPGENSYWMTSPGQDGKMEVKVFDSKGNPLNIKATIY